MRAQKNALANMPNRLLRYGCKGARLEYVYPFTLCLSLSRRSPTPHHQCFLTGLRLVRNKLGCYQRQQSKNGTAIKHQLWRRNPNHTQRCGYDYRCDMTDGERHPCGTGHILGIGNFLEVRADGNGHSEEHVVDYI